MFAQDICWVGFSHAAGQMEWFHCKVDDRSKLLEVPRELKPLVDMFSHSPLNLVWLTCTPSRFLLTMTFSNTPLSSSHHLTFGILLFWTMVLHLPFLRKFTKKLMIPQILCLMNLGIFTSNWYNAWIFLGFKPSRDWGVYFSCPSPQD